MATLNREMTVAQLKAAMEEESLNRGENITITDWVTKHNARTLTGFDTTVITGEVEPLTVKATSSSTVSRIVTSVDFPDDIIHLDLTNELCEDGTTARHGKITYRKNIVNGVSAGCDFRNCKVLRYSITAAAWVSGTDYGKGALVEISGWIYKKSAVDNPYIEENTVSPTTAQMWIKYLPASKPLLLGTPSSSYQIGFEDILLTGVTLAPSYLYIFDDGTGDELSDEYSNVTDALNSTGYANNSFQNTKVKDVSFSNQSEGNTIYGTGDFFANNFTGKMSNNIFLGECKFAGVSGSVHDNIFTKLNNVLLGALVASNIIHEMASSSCVSEFVFNDIKYAANTVFGSDVWGNVIRRISYCFLGYHFARNFVYDVRQLSSLQKVEYCLFLGTVVEITIEQQLLYTTIPDGTTFMTFACPDVFGLFDLVTNVGAVINQPYYKILVMGLAGNYVQFTNDDGVLVNVAL